MRIADGGGAPGRLDAGSTTPKVRTEHPPLQYRTTETNELGPIYTGRTVLDTHGIALGTVTDALYDEGAYEPSYLLVSPGVLRRSHFVPTAGASQTDAGEIVVTWDRRWFRLSPATNGRAALTSRQRRELDQHYATRC